MTLLRRAETQAQGFRQRIEDEIDFEEQGVALYQQYLLKLGE